MTTLAAAALLALLHASIVVITTLIARACVPRRLAAVRASVGVVGLACVLVVSGLALLPLPGVWPSRATSTVAQQAAPAPPVSQTEKPDRKDDAGASMTPATDAATVSTEPPAQLRFVWIERLGASLQRATEAAAPTRRGRSVLLAVVFGGLGVSLARLVVAIWGVRRLRRASWPVADESITAAINELRRRCGCRPNILVRETDQLTSAAACGWRQPVILLPTDWRAWSAEELAAVLAHEVAHIHRADYLRRLLAMTSAAVHFYHPLVRSAARRVAVDQEFAADRLARSLAADEQAYARGLARLALRYHDSLHDWRAWSSVSIMPRSSDFLARRLEMLRVKEVGPTDQRTTKWITYGASACVVMMATGAALLRAAAADEKETKPAPAEKSPEVIETARLPAKTPATPPTATPAATPQPTTDAKSAAQDLFRREAFDPSIIRPGSHGAFVIRLGELLRHPELAPHIDGLNKYMTETVHELATGFEGAVDLRDIEWIAGDLVVTVKGPSSPKSDQSRLMIGSGGMVIRISRGSVDAESTAQAIPGAMLKQYQGKSYVQMPAIPAIGPLPVRIRFPDDKTMVIGLVAREDTRPVEAEDKLLQKLFDDTPRTHAWANTWKAVDGGLVTVLFDNSKAGWPELPKSNLEYPPSLAPMFEKTSFVAASFDWTEKGNHTGLRIRATCADQESVKDVHLAAMTAMTYWPAALLQGGDSVAKYQKRILQCLSTVRIEPSPTGGAEHYVSGTADVGWDTQELIEIFRTLGN